MRLALYQPDIPQNTGAVLRTCVCLGVPVDIIRPTGFELSDKSLRRTGLDYLTSVDLTIHESFAAFDEVRRSNRHRLVVLSTAGAVSHVDFAFGSADSLLLGRESAGVPAEIHALADARIKIPLKPGARSLNVAIAAAMALGEALRQTRAFAAP